MPRIATRLFALIAAYALALHALMFSLTLPLHFAGHGSATLSLFCSSLPDTNRPGGQPASVPDCCIAGCPEIAWVPPHTAVIAIVVSAETPIPVAYAIAPVPRATVKTPQIPRAPPLA